MSALFKITQTGLGCSVQDQGRIGYGRDGVPRSGALDPNALALGNALLGNEPFEAALEFRLVGPLIEVLEGEMRVALACDGGAQRTQASTGEVEQLVPWQTVTLSAGDCLKINPTQDLPTGYVCIEGGLDVDVMLGSRSSYGRASLGIQISAGEEIKTRLAPASASHEWRVADPMPVPSGPLRVMWGPQDDYFAADMRDHFISQPYSVSGDADRMGVRLEGETPIAAKPDKGHDLISDGLGMGAIQVPASGQPIILSVDCQTIGGYPKIATVIAADLPRLGQLKAGARFGFKVVERAEAVVLWQAQQKALATAIDSIKPYFGQGAVDLAALYNANLIGGVVDAQRPDHFPSHVEEPYGKG